MKKMSAMLAVLVLSFSLSGCPGNPGSPFGYPADFPGTVWISQDPEMSFTVKADGACLGTLVQDGQQIDFMVRFENGSLASFLDCSKLLFFYTNSDDMDESDVDRDDELPEYGATYAESSDATLLYGRSEFTQDKYIVTEILEDNVFGGVDSVEFVRGERGHKQAPGTDPFSKAIGKVWVEAAWDGTFPYRRDAFRIARATGGVLEGTFRARGKSAATTPSGLLADDFWGGTNLVGRFSGRDAECEIPAAEEAGMGIAKLSLTVVNEGRIAMQGEGADGGYEPLLLFRPYNIADERDLRVDHTVPVLLEQWGDDARLVLGVLETGADWRTVVLLTDGGGDILYDFGHSRPMGTAFPEFSFHDLDQDGLGDLTLIERPPGGKARVASVYFQEKSAAFALNETLGEVLNYPHMGSPHNESVLEVVREVEQLYLRVEADQGAWPSERPWAKDREWLGTNSDLVVVYISKEAR
jgi:hypothetical protein